MPGRLAAAVVTLTVAGRMLAQEALDAPDGEFGGLGQEDGEDE
jgi:hypothetical protein